MSSEFFKQQIIEKSLFNIYFLVLISSLYLYSSMPTTLLLYWHCTKIFQQGFLQQMWPNPQFSADLVAFAEEILNGKLHFLRNVKKRKRKWKYKFFICCPILNCILLNPLSTNPKKWSATADKLFECVYHFVGLALKGLINSHWSKLLS